MRPRAALLPALGLWSLTLAVPAVSAQSIVAGSVSGMILASDGSTVPRATLTLRSSDLGLVREAVSDGLGRYRFGFVTPGTYEIRVEALGFRPLVAGPVVVNGGGARSVTLTLEEAPPPVTSVDSVFIGGAAATAWGPGGVRFGPGEIRGFPDRLERMSAVAALAPFMDDALGSEGLPGSLSVIVADGVPFNQANHPALKGDELETALFPRASLSSVRALANGPDVEWSGGAGAFLALSSGSSSSIDGLGVHGAWSGDALWSSSHLDFETPGLMSAWAGLEASVDLVPDTSHLFLVGDGFQQEIPLAPRITPEAASALTGVPSEVAEALGRPTVARTTRISGLGRLDWWLSPTRRFMIRAAAGRLTREFEGDGPAYLAYGGALPEESTDFSVAAGLTTETREGWTLEFRGGASGSSRVFDPTVGELAPGMLVRPGIALGSAAGGLADVSRVDVHLSPVVHFPMGGGGLKAGVATHFARHTTDWGAWDQRAYFYDDGGALAADRGLLLGGTTAESSFSVPELSAFAQYDWEAAPGLRLTIGGRIDWEKVPDQADLYDPWLDVSGLPNDSLPPGLVQVGGGTALTWDVTGTGGTMVVAALTIHQGDLDPTVLHEAIARDGAATGLRYWGTNADWTSASTPSGAYRDPSMSIVGPEARAPQSSRVTAGLVQQLTDRWSLYVGGAARRTDFLPRRRNLNLAVEPTALDANGRAVYGTLVKDGALVTADPASMRRFSQFDDVFALDTDGWSEYRAVTVGLEHRSEMADLFAAYTRSKTEDNWVGARSGLPDAQLGPGVPGERKAWEEGTSDFDVPDRLTLGGTVRLGGDLGAEISAVYRYSSGLPFTPRYRTGVDVNGDGSGLNDVAWVPDAGQLSGLGSEWDCLGDQTGGFAERNSCRATARQSLDASVRIRLGNLGGRPVRLVIDGLGLIEDEGGVLDEALLLVDPTTDLVTSPDGTSVTVPVTVNPDFGEVLMPFSPGRILRVGFRIGG